MSKVGVIVERSLVLVMRWVYYSATLDEHEGCGLGSFDMYVNMGE
jgi:hypothetical protein